MVTSTFKRAWRLLPDPIRDRFWSMYYKCISMYYRCYIIRDWFRTLYYRYFYVHEPVNFKQRDSTSIGVDVETAFDHANFIHSMLSGFGFDPSKVSFLEVGPGINFGAQLLLAQYGTKVMVADRFLSPWDENYHAAFYRQLRDRAGAKSGPLDAVIIANHYPPEVITLVEAPAENLSGIPDASLDVVLSNAVLEHVSDLKAACRSFARVTKPGGINSHQVDFRDHENFERPLEFLLLGQFTSKIEFLRKRGERGNRYRASELIRLMRTAGFEIVDVEVNIRVDENYLRNFIPRLRRSHSVYRSWPEDDLRILSARITARRR